MLSAESARIGAAATVTETPTAVGTVSGSFLTANPLRKTIIVGGANGGRVTVSSLGTAVLDQGLTLAIGAAPLRISVEDFGPLVAGAWTAIASVAVTVGVFTEVVAAG